MRPTQNKVKEALFNIIAGRVVDADFLDLYAGSGQIGIEALARGAKSATFVENSQKCMKVLRENLNFTNHESRVTSHAIQLPVSRAIPYLARNKRKFDLIFADPPYYKNEAKNCLLILDKYDIYKNTTIVIIEHFKKDILPNTLKSLKLSKIREYGDTFLTLYVRRDE